MEMETPLPAEAAQPGQPDGDSPGTDGLAAALAVEHGAQPGNGPDQGNPADNPEKRRPGRPLIHGLYSKAAGSDGKNPVRATGETQMGANQVDGGPVPRVVIPPGLLSSVIQETLTLSETFAQSKLEEKALAAGLSQAEIEPQLKRAALGPGRKKLLGDLTPLIAKEWGIDPEISPTAAALTLLVPPMFGAASAYMTLSKLAAQRQRDSKETPEKENP